MKLKKYKIKIKGQTATVREVDSKEYDVKFIISIDGFEGISGGGMTLKEAKEEVTEALQMYKDYTTDAFK